MPYLSGFLTLKTTPEIQPRFDPRPEIQVILGFVALKRAILTPFI